MLPYSGSVKLLVIAGVVLAVALALGGFPDTVHILEILQDVLDALIDYTGCGVDHLAMFFRGRGGIQGIAFSMAMAFPNVVYSAWGGAAGLVARIGLGELLNAMIGK
jgi:hypothetical protein